MIKKTYLQLIDIEEDEESVKTCPQGHPKLSGKHTTFNIYKQVMQTHCSVMK